MLYYEKKAKRKGFKFIVGIDEAGRGSLAGPVVAASVILGKRVFKERIDDSKKLSSCMRERAFFEIMRNCLVSVGVVNNRQIDRVNILNATRQAMKQAVLGLGIKPDCLLVDGNMDMYLPYHSVYIIRGDSRSLSVAAASIIAKVTRDHIMLELDKKYPRYEFSRHKGYGTFRHVSLLKKFGPSPVHRMSFAPVRAGNIA
ncbi:MAG: ribonuclease HII [Candidatus Omnitrophica bacterium]|nr:ribonuclease HII [Candidatus Omnitrophota bacterium]